MRNTHHTRGGRHALRHWFAAIALTSLLWVGAAGIELAHAQTALAAPKAAPTFAIINPLYYSQVAQGPVGTYVAVQATSGWTAGASIVLAVQAGVLPAGTPCITSAEIPVIPVAPITVDAKGAFTSIFPWPALAAIPDATYTICATEENGGTQSGASSNTFIVLSANSPTLAISSDTIHAGDTVTFSGANWLPSGQTISISLVTAGFDQPIPLTNSNNTISSDQNGNFTASIVLPTTYIGMRSFLVTMGNPAQLTPTGKSYYPLQFASKQYDIQGVQPTPTVQVTPTTAPTATPEPVANTTPSGNSGHSSGGNGGNSSTILIGLLSLIALVLFVAGVVVAVLALRGRQPAPTDWAAGPRRPSGPPAAGAMWDDTEAGDPEWNRVWQNPAGQPWSGRTSSRPYSGPLPPAYPSYEDDEDPYRTRMGAPPAPEPQRRPQTSRPTVQRPPGSQPIPPPPLGRAGQDTISGGETVPGWPPPPTPPRN